MIRWDPEPGVLWVREIKAKLGADVTLVESHLGFALRPRIHKDAGLHYVSLLEMEFNGVVSPKHTGIYVDYIYGKEDQLTDKLYVSRHLASQEDIIRFLNGWDSKEQMNPDEWVNTIDKKYISDTPGLTKSEFQNLKTLCFQLLLHPLNRNVKF